MLQKIGIGIATSAILTFAAATSAFATNIAVFHNGAFSLSTVSVHTSNTNVVTQTNYSTVVTDVSNTNSSGGNTANFNTGGKVGIGTGDATSDTTISVGGPTNIATQQPPCGCDSPINIEVSKNGAYSIQTVKVKQNNTTTLDQLNSFSVSTGVTNIGNTGNNDGSFNTGGSVGIGTGGSNSSVTIDVSAPTNVAQ